MNLPKNTPDDLSELLQVMAKDFPAILSGNLVGIYLWGSLTYEAFDETCSDVDCIGVTRRELVSYFAHNRRVLNADGMM